MDGKDHQHHKKSHGHGEPLGFPIGSNKDIADRLLHCAKAQDTDGIQAILNKEVLGNKKSAKDQAQIIKSAQVESSTSPDMLPKVYDVKDHKGNLLALIFESRLPGDHQADILHGHEFQVYRLKTKDTASEVKDKTKPHQGAKTSEQTDSLASMMKSAGDKVNELSKEVTSGRAKDDIASFVKSASEKLNETSQEITSGRAKHDIESFMQPVTDKAAELSKEIASGRLKDEAASFMKFAGDKAHDLSNQAIESVKDAGLLPHTHTEHRKTKEWTIDYGAAERLAAEEASRRGQGIHNLVDLVSKLYGSVADNELPRLHEVNVVEQIEGLAGAPRKTTPINQD